MIFMFKTSFHCDSCGKSYDLLVPSEEEPIKYGPYKNFKCKICGETLTVVEVIEKKR